MIGNAISTSYNSAKLDDLTDAKKKLILQQVWWSNLISDTEPDKNRIAVDDKSNANSGQNNAWTQHHWKPATVHPSCLV